MERRRRTQGAEPRERSRDENRKKVEKVGHKEEHGVYIRKVTEEANLLPDVEDKLGNFVLFMSTMM